MVSACTRKPARTGFAPALLLLLASVASAADSVETVQRAAADWAKLRAETVRLADDWQQQRASLDASLTALQARIETLKTDRDSAAAAVALSNTETTNVTAANEKSREALATIDTRVQQLARSLVALRPFLPPRLSEGLELAFKSIQDTKLGPAERMQHVVTIFNRCGLFNKAITFAEQELALDRSDSSRLLEVLYFGLSHAYAYDRTNKAAYFGHPGASGWTWEPRPAAADAVARMIAIHGEHDDPVFVVVPAQVSEPSLPGNPH